jgi:hypothetical protein
MYLRIQNLFLELKIKKKIVIAMARVITMTHQRSAEHQQRS